MPLAVNLPKKIAIRNKRLAIFHFSMVFGIGLGLLLTKFVFGTSYVLPIPAHTQLEIAWDMDNSILAMENFFNLNPSIQTSCQLTAGNDRRMRWGQEFLVRKTCTKMCAISDVTLHTAWNRNESVPPEQRLCWTDFKSYGLNQKYTALQFLGTQGGRSVSLITAKNDWVVDHVAAERTNLIEIVPQGLAAQLNFRINYKLAHSPPWFLSTGQSTVKTYGTDQNAKTLILDATGTPWGDIIPPGERITIPVTDVMTLAKSDAGSAVDPWTMSSMVNGGQVDGRAQCYNTDQEIIDKLGPQAKDRDWSFGASLKEPVCVLEFTLSSSTYEVHVNYGPTDSTYTSEVVSETTGYLFSTLDDVGSFQVLDFNTLLIELTSMLVLLGIPVRVTSFVASRLLGPLSQMYRRVIVEPYDIEESTASTVLVLAANTSQFYSMKHAASDGKDVVGLDAFEQLLSKALEARAETMNAKEVTSLAVFCYDAMKSRDLSVTEDTGILSTLDFDMGWDKKKKVNTDKSIKHEEGVSMDQFNQVRLDQEKVTFDAVVELFDKDRKRGLLETIFTPLGIQDALDRAADGDRYKRHWLVEAAFIATHSITSSILSPAQSASRNEKKKNAALEEKALEECAAGSEDRVPHMLVHSSSSVAVDVAPAAKDLEDGLRLPEEPSEGDFAMTQRHTKDGLAFPETMSEGNLEGVRPKDDIVTRLTRVEQLVSILEQEHLSMKAVTLDTNRSNPLGSDWASAIVQSYGDLTSTPSERRRSERRRRR